jgi:glycolate oxidase iron-sulfur subunit
VRAQPNPDARKTKISSRNYAAIGKSSPYGIARRLKTSFTAQQLARPDIAEADGILRTCVHYGFCTATCPTYLLFRDENDSPRGRIDLIRGMLENGGVPDRKTVHHLDRCLSCLACVPTCAAKVDYAHLIDIARDHIETHFRRPLGDHLLRLMLAKTLPYPRRFAAALRLARVVRPFTGLMPRRLANLFELAMRETRPECLAPQVYPAEGIRRLRVLLLTGCAQQALDGEINAATIRVLRRHGCEVVIAEGTGCCGALPLHMGRAHEGKALAKKMVAVWSAELAKGVDAVAVNTSGCGTTVKDYGHLLATAAAHRVAALAQDISEILDTLDLKVAEAKPYRVAYPDACSLQHGQRVLAPPRRILAKAEFDVVDLPEKHFCCGSAGTYNLLQPEIAKALGLRKAAHAESTEPDIIAAGNLGCMVQISRYTQLPVLHTVSLADWATGGPLPVALQGRHLREPNFKPIVPDPTPSPATAAPPSDANFW